MAEPTDSIRVEPFPPRLRLDAYLRRHFPTVSRVTLHRLIENGDITVDDRRVKPTHAPRPGETILIRWPKARPVQLQPLNLALSVLYEDEDLIVIDKPPDLVVHPAAGHEERTLVNALLHHCAGQLSGIGGVERPGIVHRLDKDTSGCIVAAKNDFAHNALAKQFADRTIEKTYVAVVHGELTESAGDIRAPIARHPNHRKVMAVREGQGKEAWTSFRIMERLRHATLVEIALHTGRTHQIRVHFKHIGYPLVGDDTYGKKAAARLKELTGYAPPRILLHSFRIGFFHPRSGLHKLLQAPIPADFQEARTTLRRAPPPTSPPPSGCLT